MNTYRAILNNFRMYFGICEPSGSVTVVSDYGLNDWGSIPDRGRGFFPSNLCVSTGCGPHPACCAVGTGGSFPGGIERPGCDADHSPLSSAEVKKG
jgi:hypothetical protein